jgi:5-methylcytosine-specific restriction endonuclease McrA
VREGHRNARVTVCPAGHGYTPENTYLAPGSVRQCKICRRGHARASYLKRRDVYLQQRRDRYQAEHDEQLAARKAWALANPEKVALTARIKRQRKRAAGKLTAPEWRSVLEKYGSACLCCGSDGPPTIDHVIPISRGGMNTVDNVQPLCNGCNMRKSTQTIDYRPPGAVAV